MGEARRRRNHRIKQDFLIITPNVKAKHFSPRLSEIDRPYTRETPAADWRERGERDPHGYYYDNKKRHEIMGGHLTDDEVAYKCGMASGRDCESIATLNMAKERIRWLSRKLVRAEKRLRELEDK